MCRPYGNVERASRQHHTCDVQETGCDGGKRGEVRQVDGALDLEEELIGTAGEVGGRIGNSLMSGLGMM